MEQEILKRINELLFELTYYRSKPSDSNFKRYLEMVRTETSSLVELSSDDLTKAQLSELACFSATDEKSYITRSLYKLSAFKYRLDWFSDWKLTGKYLFDYHRIELKLNGIRSRLNSKRNIE